jgi:hypothetical protein
MTAAQGGVPTADAELGAFIALLQQERLFLESHTANKDAEIVHAACAGLGTSDSRLISVVCSRTKPQLQAIDQVYRARYGKSLKHQVR